jgi:hypothetical protein
MESTSGLRNLDSRIPTEGSEFVLPLKCNANIRGVATRTPTEKELLTCPSVS